MFITFEGPEGSGKTTQITVLAEFLRQRGFPVYVTREPGGTTVGDQIRQTLMDHANKALLPRTEILLFLASRAQHVAEVIRPRLEKGEIVLCDRYRDATLAYQGYGYQLDVGILRKLNDFATEGLKPDLTLLLDVDIETGLRRKEAEGEWNRMDAFPLDFHQRVRRGYHELARAEPGRWMCIDASLSAQKVQEAIRRAVLERLGQNTGQD